jgi:hypothetical protein
MKYHADKIALLHRATLSEKLNRTNKTAGDIRME